MYIVCTMLQGAVAKQPKCFFAKVATATATFTAVAAGSTLPSFGQTLARCDLNCDVWHVSGTMYIAGLALPKAKGRSGRFKAPRLGAALLICPSLSVKKSECKAHFRSHLACVPASQGRCYVCGERGWQTQCGHVLQLAPLRNDPMTLRKTNVEAHHFLSVNHYKWGIFHPTRIVYQCVFWVTKCQDRLTLTRHSKSHCSMTNLERPTEAGPDGVVRSPRSWARHGSLTHVQHCKQVTEDFVTHKIAQ